MHIYKVCNLLDDCDPDLWSQGLATARRVFNRRKKEKTPAILIRYTLPNDPMQLRRLLVDAANVTSASASITVALRKYEFETVEIYPESLADSRG